MTFGDPVDMAFRTSLMRIVEEFEAFPFACVYLPGGEHELAGLSSVRKPSQLVDAAIRILEECCDTSPSCDAVAHLRLMCEQLAILQSHLCVAEQAEDMVDELEEPAKLEEEWEDEEDDEGEEWKRGANVDDDA